MCEVWKWIVIVEGGLLVVSRVLWTFPVADPLSERRWLRPNRRLWWLGVIGFALAVGIYVVHCSR